MISKVIGKPVEHGAIGASPRVSGSMKSHYAPEHVLKIVSADDLSGETQFLARHFKTFSLIAPEKIAKRFCTVAEKVTRLQGRQGTSGQPLQVAARTRP